MSGRSWMFAATLALVSVALAWVFYAAQPVYAVAFALVALLVAGYVALMAKLFSRGVGARGFLGTWLAALMLLAGAECVVRYAYPAPAGGAGFVEKIGHALLAWKNRDNASLSSDTNVPIAMHEKMLADLLKLFDAQRCHERDQWAQGRATGFAHVLEPQNRRTVEQVDEGLARIAAYRKIRGDTVADLQRAMQRGRRGIIDAHDPFGDVIANGFTQNEQRLVDLEKSAVSTQQAQIDDVQDMLELIRTSLPQTDARHEGPWQMPKYQGQWQQLSADLNQASETLRYFSMGDATRRTGIEDQMLQLVGKPDDPWSYPASCRSH
jgi:hypothetical protein